MSSAVKEYNLKLSESDMYTYKYIYILYISIYRWVELFWRETIGVVDFEGDFDRE